MNQFTAPVRDALYSLLELQGIEDHYAEIAPETG
jgi:hypothetical protein